MNDNQPLIDLTLTMLKLVVIASLPAVIAAAIIGLLVGIAQAVTQLQDQAMSFAIKFLGVAAVIALTLPWLGKSMDTFVRQVFDAMVRVA